MTFRGCVCCFGWKHALSWAEANSFALPQTGSASNYRDGATCMQVFCLKKRSLIVICARWVGLGWCWWFKLLEVCWCACPGGDCQMCVAMFTFMFFGEACEQARSLSFNVLLGNAIDCYTGLRGCFVLWKIERGGTLLYGVSMGKITMELESWALSKHEGQCVCEIILLFEIL